MAKLTLEGVAVAAVVGAGDLGAEVADTKGVALGPLSATDLYRSALTLGGAAANYLNLELKYSDKVVQSTLPLWEKTVYKWALKAFGTPALGSVKAITVRAASSGLAQYANPALAGAYRSITA
jgi:hypothetical protein